MERRIVGIELEDEMSIERSGLKAAVEDALERKLGWAGHIARSVAGGYGMAWEKGIKCGRRVKVSGEKYGVRVSVGENGAENERKDLRNCAKRANVARALW